MPSVSDLLQTKGHSVWSVGPDASVYAALELMAAKDVGALLVLEEGRVAETGSHAALLARGGLYAQLVSRQLAAAYAPAAQ